MKYTTLGVMITGQCNAECEICSVSCSPKVDKTLAKQPLMDLISSCSGTSIGRVSFTGGEPFLKYELLCDLVEHAHRIGLHITVVTNAYWAHNDDETLKKLGELKRLGLDSVSVSCDHYHERYIDVGNVNRIARASLNLGLHMVVAVQHLKEESIGNLVDRIVHDAPYVEFIISSCQPTGRAKKELSVDSFSRTINGNNLRCPYNGIITVSYDGFVYPCCSHFVFDTKLGIGTYETESLTTILHKIKNNGLLYILRNHGLDPFVTEFMPNVKNTMLSMPCEVCSALFSADLGKYNAFVKEFFAQKNNG